MFFIKLLILIVDSSEKKIVGLFEPYFYLPEKIKDFLRQNRVFYESIF